MDKNQVATMIQIFTIENVKKASVMMSSLTKNIGAMVPSFLHVVESQTIGIWKVS